MQNASDLTHTHKKLSSEELAACRKQLEHKWKNQKVDVTLLERAWQVAYDIAALLYDEFNAKQVAVFGSLTEPMGFTNKSDIDIAVWGLTDEEHTKATDRVWDMKTGFKIDLIDIETTKEFFRDRVQQQAIPIEKEKHATSWETIYKHHNRKIYPIVEEEIYEFNRNRLTQRINDELVKIEDTLLRIRRGLELIDVAAEEVTEFIETTIANDLTDVYCGIERIFERIANEVDGHLPRGSMWHKNLLEQMTRHRPERQPVISESTSNQLENLLKFRHKVRNIYGIELRYDDTLDHAEIIGELFDDVSTDLNTFTNSLEKNMEDV